MQDSSILVLPRREYNQPVRFSNKLQKTCFSNFYEVELGNKSSHIYQFSFDTEPLIPQDSKDFLNAVIRSIKRQIKDKIDLTSYSGNMLWGLKQLPHALNVKSQFNFDGTNYKFDVIIKPAKTLSVQDLKKNPNGEKMLYQIFNNKIKQILRDKDMDQLTRGKYFEKKEVKIQEAGLNILRGFNLTLCTLKSGLFLQIDVVTRVLRANSLLEELSHNKSKDFTNSLVGSTVITNYGRRRTYRILRICSDMNPFSKFWHDKKAGQVTFSQYYQESYGLKICEKKQPLVEVVMRTEKKMVKGGQIVKTQIKGFLIPEFISLTGMSDEQRADHRVMRDIAPETKLNPQQRMKQAANIVSVFNESGQLRVGNLKKILAYQLYQPYVKLGQNYVLKNHGDGNMNVRQKLKNAIYFKDWVVVYSVGKNSKYDDDDADHLVDVIKKASAAFGVQFNDPGFITCDPSSDSWKSGIKKDVEKAGKPQIIVLYFNPNEEKFYGLLKQYITCELKMPCQAVRRRTITKAKNPLSAASKIIMQMNQKVGGTAWEIISKQKAYTSIKKTMYGAIAISKGKKGYTLAFVGTLDLTFTKVFSYVRTGFKNKEDIPQKEFEDAFVNWAKHYVGLNKVGPDLILIYREGLSVQQTERQVKNQIEALRAVIKKIGQKTKKENYYPEVIYTIVATKINTRIFDCSNGGSANHSNKFIPNVLNPNSGTTVFDELSVDKHLDFHLTAQRVTEGTCTPTHYTVVHYQSKMTQEDLAQFTYEQCFNYYNWTGAVKVPAALQCANKAAKLIGQAIQADVTSGEVQTSFYFL